jgi:hypothetical protein
MEVNAPKTNLNKPNKIRLKVTIQPKNLKIAINVDSNLQISKQKIFKQFLFLMK